MKILITGGFGYLGGRLGQYLADSPDHEIRLGTRREAGAPDWLPRAESVRTDWGSPARLEAVCSDMDAVVHLAGMNAQDCAADPVAALETNGMATVRLLQAAIRQGVKRFVYMSTAHVYGSPLTGEISERDCPVNLHPYATSHRAGEDVVRSAHARGEIEGVVVRLSNAFGAPAHKQANCWMLLVNDLCRQAMTHQHMVLHSSGMQRRDFIALTDACRAIGHLLQLPTERLGDGLFNVGGAWSPTVLEMARLVADRILAVTGSKPEIRRQSGQDVEDERLDYRVDRLLESGFALSGGSCVTDEVDGLIEFCLRGLTEAS